jgi:arylsulfatase A-like enzyme
VALAALAGVAWSLAPGPASRFELVLDKERDPAAPRPVGPDGQPLPNFLVLLADDVGQDMIGAYEAHPSPPRTPRIDALAEQGMLFRQAIANPVCSPTRATLITGRYGYRYGIGRAIPPKNGWGLPEDERSIAQALSDKTDGAYTSVVVGKWHLSTPSMGGYDHPARMGFAHHVGTMGNIIGMVPGKGVPQTYDFWSRTIDGEARPARGYITSKTIDDAVRLTRELPEPWFMLVAFHAAHFPMHQPPDGMYYTPIPELDEEQDNVDTWYYRAMVESLDMEIGRLLDQMPADVKAETNVLFLGDNGSAPVGVTHPWTKPQSKGSLLRGGIRVPFVMSGPSVPQAGETQALVNTTDLYATVMDLLDLDEPAPTDSISFAPVLEDPSLSPRTIAYAERFSPNGMGDKEEWDAAVRDDRHKIVVWNRRMLEFFDLQEDPMEENNLFLGEETPELKAVIDRLKPSFPPEMGRIIMGKPRIRGEEAAEDDG